MAGFSYPLGLGLPLTSLIAGDTFFVLYLGLMARLASVITTEGLRHRAEVEDEGMPFIAAVTVVAIAFSIGSIFQMLNQKAGNLPPVQFLLALASVPIGWLVLHTMMAFHYAQLFYSRRHEEARRAGRPAPHKPRPAGEEKALKDAGGLVFPGTGQPQAWDFLYFSFVIGMSAQVSDVEVTAPAIRGTVMGHAIAAFFYNTVLLTLAVNTAVTLAN